MRMEIDDTDKNIVEVLQHNAQLSNRKICKKVGVTVETVMLH